MFYTTPCLQSFAEFVVNMDSDLHSPIIPHNAAYRLVCRRHAATTPWWRPFGGITMTDQRVTVRYMDAETPLGTFLTAAAAHQLTRFVDRNVHVPGSDVVHAMKPQKLITELIPGLACGTAVGGWDWMRLEPTTLAVTCHHCLRHDEHGVPGRRVCGTQLVLHLRLP